MDSLLIFRHINDGLLLDEIRAAGLETAGIRKLQGGGYELFIHEKDKVAAQAIVDAHDHTYVRPPPPPDPEIEARRQLEDLINTYREPTSLQNQAETRASIARISEWISRYGRNLN